MSGIPDAELAGMRTAIEGLALPDLAKILSQTFTVTGTGAVSESWGTIATRVPCRLDASVGREQVVGEAVRPYIRYTLTLPQSVSFTASMRAEVGGVQYANVGTLDGSWKGVGRYVVERVA